MDRYHPALGITIELQLSLKPVTLPFHDFKSADYENLNAFYLNVDWLSLYSSSTLDSKVVVFYDIIQRGISTYVPVRSQNINNFPYWFSRELKHKTILKKEAHTTYKKCNCKKNYRKFSELKRECKILNKQYYKNYIDKIEQVRDDANVFWKFVKHKKRGNGDIPSTMSWDNLTGDSVFTVN
ncbi:PREDICTED: uncharacterized protein LOC108974167 isoform X2 [Bactrocera latifrons]|uniref:uncharacterized protein LOC108974167 isoform X2 n=1 Tax=Bactrocera latifrons TaxID=174628 RepID=UPI0008DE37DA|nr:PREDICTED: uncharacterized protein LOC108974167 isoform X2 [Bactrocera latifrons]